MKQATGLVMEHIYPWMVIVRPFPLVLVYMMYYVLNHVYLCLERGAKDNTVTQGRCLCTDGQFVFQWAIWFTYVMNVQKTSKSHCCFKMLSSCHLMKNWNITNVEINFFLTHTDTHTHTHTRWCSYLPDYTVCGCCALCFP